jgi:hypothetical protein
MMTPDGSNQTVSLHFCEYQGPKIKVTGLRPDRWEKAFNDSEITENRQKFRVVQFFHSIPRQSLSGRSFPQSPLTNYRWNLFRPICMLISTILCSNQSLMMQRRRETKSNSSVLFSETREERKEFHSEIL